MKKLIVALLLVGLVATLGTAPAQAGKKKKKKPAAPAKVVRTAEHSYDAPALGTQANGGAGACLRPTNSCGDFVIGEGELYLMIEIDDASGTPTPFSVSQDTDPNAVGSEHDLGVFCGSTPEPLLLQPMAPVVVFPWLLGSQSCPGIATTGTITATISNLP